MTLEEAAEYVKARDNFILTSHDGPDADGLGAAYALGLTLGALGKTVAVVFSTPPSPKFQFLDQRGLFKILSSPEALPFEPSLAHAIIVDTNDIGYLGNKLDGLIEQAKGILVIDHHEPRDTLGPTHCVDPTASSTCELVYRLTRILGIALPLDGAEALFAGIVYDTGSFAYAKTSAGTFETALELVRQGVQPAVIHNRMYESASIGVLVLQKLVYSTLELKLDNRVALQSLKSDELVKSGASYEDAEELVNVPLRGKTVEVSVFFKENLDGKLHCSLRSKGLVNVAHLAQTFGGGGHKTAAGFTCARPLEAMKEAVLENIKRALGS